MLHFNGSCIQFCWQGRQTNVQYLILVNIAYLRYNCLDKHRSQCVLNQFVGTACRVCHNFSWDFVCWEVSSSCQPRRVTQFMLKILATFHFTFLFLVLTVEDQSKQLEHEVLENQPSKIHFIVIKIFKIRPSLEWNYYFKIISNVPNAQICSWIHIKDKLNKTNETNTCITKQ